MSDNDLYASWGRAVANSIGDIHLPSGQDAYEIVVSAYDRELTCEDFHALQDTDFARLSDAANKVCETDRISPVHMREAVERLRFHQPLDDR